MPVIQANPFDNAQYILNIAVANSGDAGGPQGLAGNILNVNQPYVITMLSERYRYLQDRLIAGGVETFSKYGHIYGITPTQTGNPRTLVTISALGYWDGQQVWPGITLPPDLIKPLEMWECQTGGTAWVPMIQAADSISTRSTSYRFNIWDFENETLFLPGASQQNDIKMKYLCYAPDITGPQSQIMILHAQTALAALMIEAASLMLGGIESAAVWHTRANDAINQIINRTARKEAYASFHRIPFRSRSRGRY